MTEPKNKIMTLAQACEWRNQLRARGKALVVTNGCFDILHHGHADYLYRARQNGDAVLVLINSDASVRKLKGETRPIVSEDNRAFLIAALESVDAVVIFPAIHCDKELATLAPDIYIKAGDYTLETLNENERAALQKNGTKIKFMPFVAGFSTTDIIKKVLATVSKN